MIRIQSEKEREALIYLAGGEYITEIGRKRKMDRKTIRKYRDKWINAGHITVYSDLTSRVKTCHFSDELRAALFDNITTADVHNVRVTIEVKNKINLDDLKEFKGIEFLRDQPMSNGIWRHYRVMHNGRYIHLEVHPKTLLVYFPSTYRHLPKERLADEENRRVARILKNTAEFFADKQRMRLGEYKITGEVHFAWESRLAYGIELRTPGIYVDNSPAARNKKGVADIEMKDQKKATNIDKAIQSFLQHPEVYEKLPIILPKLLELLS